MIVFSSSDINEFHLAIISLLPCAYLFLEHMSAIRNRNEESKLFFKMSPDVREKSLCLMFINYRQHILELRGRRGKKNTICCTTGQEIHPCGCCGFRLVCGFNVCLSFLEREKPGGRRIWDSIYGQDGKPTQMSGVKNSFNWQVKEVCSVELRCLWQMGFCPCHCVYSWHARPCLVKPGDCLLRGVGFLSLSITLSNFFPVFFFFF